MRALFLTIVTMALLLSGCAGTTPAPVAERPIAAQPSQPSQSAPPAAAPVKPMPAPREAERRSGFHIVKKGDTLYGIALEYGQDYKDIALWNNLDNPNLIVIGQELRVAPPADSQSAGGAVAIPLGSDKPSEPRPATVSGPVKRAPKGGTLAYSDEAWARIQREAQVSAAKPEAPQPMAPTQGKEDKDDVKAGTGATDDHINWAWPHPGPLVASFNDGNNKGVDLSGKLGDPVLAAAPGRVVYAGDGLRGYGKLVIVKHNNLYLSAYAHNSKILVKEGQQVGKGQKIAELGDSDAERPKLHFEIRKLGKPVDPVQLLPRRN